MVLYFYYDGIMSLGNFLWLFFGNRDHGGNLKAKGATSATTNYNLPPIKNIAGTKYIIMNLILVLWSYHTIIMLRLSARKNERICPCSHTSIPACSSWRLFHLFYHHFNLIYTFDLCYLKSSRYFTVCVLLKEDKCMH